MVSFIETYTTDSLSVIFAALNISWFIIPFHCYCNNEYAQLWIRASATVWRALVLSPCLQEALPFHNCSTISSCNSFCSLPQPPASPQIGGMDTAVSAISCQLSLLYSNCRSLVPKLDNLHAQANSLNPCITALTETWLDASISDHELCIPGYSVLCCDRNRWGSGVLLYVRSDLPILWTSSHHSLELLFVDIRLRQGNMLIGLFYRPPSAPVSIIDDLDATLSDIHPTRLSCTLLLGDFNINLLSATPNINPCFLPMKDLAGKFNLTQVVTEPTRCTNDSSSLIDHVDLFDASLLQSCLTPPPLCSSDHNCLLVKLNRVIPRPVKYKRTIWFYQRADFDSASEELEDLDCDNTQSDINNLWSNWEVSFLNVMTRYIAHKWVTIRKSLPWLTHALSLLFKKRDRLHQRAKTLNSPTAWLSYRKARNRAVSAIRSAKRKFFSNLSYLVKTPKEFWSAYHSLLPNRQTTSKCELLNCHTTKMEL